MATDLHLQEWIPSPCCASTTRQGSAPRASSASSRMTSTLAERPPRWTSTATGTRTLLLSLLLQLGSAPVSIAILPYLLPSCMRCIIEASRCCIPGRCPGLLMSVSHCLTAMAGMRLVVAAGHNVHANTNLHLQGIEKLQITCR